MTASDDKKSKMPPAKYLLDLRRWGPAAWNFAQAVAFTMPVHPTLEEQETYARFFHYFGKVLPCPSCRIHWSEHQKKHPIDLKGPVELGTWLSNIHNTVNKVNDKPQMDIDDVKMMYGPANFWKGIKKQEQNRIPNPVAENVVIGQNYVPTLNNTDNCSDWSTPKIVCVVLVSILLVLVITLLGLSFYKLSNPAMYKNRFY